MSLAMEALRNVGIFLLVLDTILAIGLSLSLFDAYGGMDGWKDIVAWLVTCAVAVAGWTLVL